MALKRDKFDKVVSDLIRVMNRYKCEHCGLQGGPTADDRRMECAHIFGRRNASTRYDLNNVLCLCHSCHRQFTENPIEFTKWLEYYMGTDKLDRLRLKANQVKKWLKGEKDLIYKEYRLKLKKLETV